MCLADLYDFTPDQREAIAKVESLLADWRAHYRSMPAVAATTLLRNPSLRNEVAAVGAHYIQGEAA
jgi:hypothetical protein